MESPALGTWSLSNWTTGEVLNIPLSKMSFTHSSIGLSSLFFLIPRVFNIFWVGLCILNVLSLFMSSISILCVWGGWVGLCFNEKLFLSFVVPI